MSTPASTLYFPFTQLGELEQCLDSHSPTRDEKERVQLVCRRAAHLLALAAPNNMSAFATLAILVATHCPDTESVAFVVDAVTNDPKCAVAQKSEMCVF